MSCVNSRPFAEATGPRRGVGGRPGDPRGGSRGQPLPAARVAPEEASPGFLGHVVGAISNANVSGVGSFLPITVHFWHKLAKHLRRPASRRAPGEARSDGGGRAVRLGHPLSSEGLWPSGHGLARRLPCTAVHSPVLPFLFQQRAPVSPDSAQRLFMMAPLTTSPCSFCMGDASSSHSPVGGAHF